MCNKLVFNMFRCNTSQTFLSNTVPNFTANLHSPWDAPHWTSMEPWHRSLSRASIAPLVWWSNQKRPCRNSTFQRAVRRMVVSVWVFLGGDDYNILQYPDIGTSELQPPDMNWRFQHHSTINHQPPISALLYFCGLLGSRWPPLGHMPWPSLAPFGSNEVPAATAEEHHDVGALVFALGLRRRRLYD